MSKITSQPLKIILDSNALFTPLELKIDIFEELRRLLNRNVEYILISPVKAELVMLTNKGQHKLRQQANFALKLSEKCKFVTVTVTGKLSTDDTIVEVAKKWNTPVFTNDSQLRKRLRDISLPVIYVRQKSHIEIDGLIS